MYQCEGPCPPVHIYRGEAISLTGHLRRLEERKAYLSGSEIEAQP